MTTTFANGTTGCFTATPGIGAIPQQGQTLYSGQQLGSACCSLIWDANGCCYVCNTSGVCTPVASVCPTPQTSFPQNTMTPFNTPFTGINPGVSPFNTGWGFGGGIPQGGINPFGMQGIFPGGMNTPLSGIPTPGFGGSPNPINCWPHCSPFNGGVGGFGAGYPMGGGITNPYCGPGNWGVPGVGGVGFGGMGWGTPYGFGAPNMNVPGVGFNIPTGQNPAGGDQQFRGNNA